MRNETGFRTLETNLVALQGSNGFSEELLAVLVTTLDTRNIDLFPLDRDVIRLENLTNRL